MNFDKNSDVDTYGKDTVIEETNAVLSPKKNRKLLYIFLTVFAALFIIMLIFTFFTPLVASLMLRTAFRNGIAIAPNDYENIQESVTVTKNLTYPSVNKDNLADFYIPKETTSLCPIILWVHGGAFVAGDKKDIEIYATVLASKGYAVLSINYHRAPGAKYPTPVIQTGEAYVWLKTVSNDYPIDINKIVLAGDSAGAHIVAQFAVIQTSDSYAKYMSMEQIVPKDAIKAVLLFCGPFDVSKILETNNSVLKFMLDKSAWAYFGTRDWSTKFSYEATIANHVTEAFPPTFISDGNTGSFENHGRELANELGGNGTPVETYFIPKDVEITNHEYQFIMNTPSGIESLQRTLNFLESYV